MQKKKKQSILIAIDGPSGAGKSTVSTKLAEELQGILLDTGAMYRSVAYYAIRDGIKDEKGLANIATTLEFELEPGVFNLLVNGENLGNRLRNEIVGKMASDISRFPLVRTVLTQKQKDMAEQWSKKIPVILEGRDIGTVVLPGAPFKFFVTASEDVRAMRRYDQLKVQGISGAKLDEVAEQLKRRDKQDSTRKLAPLKCAKDAIVVDTSSMEIDQVVHFMADHIRGRLRLT